MPSTERLNLRDRTEEYYLGRVDLSGCTESGQEEFVPKFNIGDAVWFATTEHTEKYVTCPHCLGYKFAKVIFGDNSEVTVDCYECAPGCESPLGVVKVYEYQVLVTQVTISGMDI